MRSRPAARPTESVVAHWRRQLAADCNNRGWQLAESAERTPAQTEEMLHAAHTAAYLAADLGTPQAVARAHMLLGLAHALAGHGTLALRYARASLDHFSTHGCPDWEIAMAHATMASAGHAACRPDLHEAHYREAAFLGSLIENPDERELFLKVFRIVATAG